MFLTVIIAFFSLIGLIVLHELGHFVLAKKFGVKVEEFGIGLPPRIIGKRIGQTIYSLNLLPLGAFVRLYGEENRISDYQSFSGKPIWQRALIVLGGVISFWLISALLLGIVMGLGAPTTVEDEENHNLINPRVQILAVTPGSPAEIVGIKPGDIIKQLTVDSHQLKVDKIKEVQGFTDLHKGKEITLTIQRGREVFNISLTPRLSPPEGEGAMGVALVRTALKSYPWHQAPWQGILATKNLTIGAVRGWATVISNLIQGNGLPPGAEVRGPIGIFELFTQIGTLGVSYFLQFIAIISIFLALFNILPIPALDGGKLLFLGIEAIIRRPIPQKIEQNITAFFFVLLIVLVISVTIKDIARLF